jgi:hypothetical protein
MRSCSPLSLVPPTLTQSASSFAYARSNLLLAAADCKSDALLEPVALRHGHLRFWFDMCWCERCANELDDVRCFRCPSGDCSGVCTVRKPVEDSDGGVSDEAVSACAECGRALPDCAAAALRAESHIVDALHSLRSAASETAAGDAGEKSAAAMVKSQSKKLEALLRLAGDALAHTHWATAALKDIAQDVYTSLGAQEFSRSADCLVDWCECWRTHLQVPSLRVARRLERVGELYLAIGRHAEGIKALVHARAELAEMGTPANHARVLDVTSKLQAALGVHA